MPPSSQTAAPSRNERRKARTRTSLLAAARRLFATNGLDRTSVAEIATEADVAHGSFYNYFDSKEDLVATLLELFLTEHLQTIERLQAGLEDPAEMISVAHRHLVALAHTEPEWAWLLVRLDVSHDVINATLGDAALRDLKSGIGSGRFQVTDPDVALQASGGALLGVIRSALRGEVDHDSGIARTGIAHAEGVLRSFGVAPEEAAEVARRPLPQIAADAAA